MSVYGFERYHTAHGDVVLRIDVADANRLLLALERLDQDGGLEPSLATLRETLRAALVTKSSGDTDSAPSSGM
jgi:hypothetical protein